MDKAKNITGRCFCGKVRYEISDEVIKTGVCHCHSCQRLTGGSAWPFLVVKSEALHISGHVKEIMRTGGSGNQVHMGFCDNCGSTLFGRPEIWPHIRTVSATTLDKPEAFLPSMHVWTENAQSWMNLNSDVPQFPGNPIVKKS
jgi:hypothetical protein